MHLTNIGLALLSAGLVVGNEFLAHKAKYANTESFDYDDVYEESAYSTSAAPSFLNSKTQPYSVNGTSLPFLPDIGESYSGLLPIDDTGRELFFWFFPSSTGAGSEEITIWLNGGPGCSSLEGLLQEMGPVVWRPGTYGPRKNMYAFNRLTNMVFIEQPVGTGYSQGTPNATNEVEVAAQFNAFWKTFMTLFSLENYPIYITGESYAGQYVPYIGDGMLNKSDTTYYNLKGIMIYDPVVGPFNLEVPVAVPFAQYNYASFPFNSSFWEMLYEKQDSCGWTDLLENGLAFPPTTSLPQVKVTKDCNLYDIIHNEIVSLNPCFDIYQVSTICPTLGNVLGYIASRTPPAIPELTGSYFNRDDVKAAIHAPVNKTWVQCAGGVLNMDTSLGSATRNGPIMRIAEKINNVIVGHATQDMVLLANQTLLTLNDLIWNGAQGFEQGPVTPFYVPGGFNSTGKRFGYKELGAWTKSRGITYVEINLSGHMVPQYQPGAAFRHLEYLLGRVPSLDSKIPFTQ